MPSGIFRPAARQTPDQVSWPSSLQSCGSTTPRHQAAAREGGRGASREARASGVLPTRRCGDANRPARRILRHYDARAIVRSIAPRTPLLPTVPKRQKPNRLKMPQRGSVALRHISLFQLPNAQMPLTIAKCPHPPTHGARTDLLRNAA